MTLELQHGGALDTMRAAFPEAPEPWVDLSTGVNPWPYPHSETSRDALARLPTQETYAAFRSAMAAAIGAPSSSVLPAPGSEMLIRLLPDVLRLDRIAILSPTYGDYGVAWRRTPATVMETDDPLAMAGCVDAVIVCNPNNPDGRIFDTHALDLARQNLAARGGWLIVDEAYADLAPELSLAPQGGAEGLVLLRSFGKFFGLAGLRLGALIAPQGLRDAMAERLGVWPVSGAALEIGARAYADAAWRRDMRGRLKVAAARADVRLEACGLKPVGGTDLYRFVQVADAHGVFDRLARAGVYVRRFDWSSTHLRIGLPATQEAFDRLEAALSP
ncbi:MAG: threonine-phosphate decarboxylase CobD [Pseudomonadota bacterium]